MRVQAVRGSEDRHLVAAAVRGQRHLVDQRAHLFDLDVLRILFRREPHDVGMLVSGDPATLLALAAGCALRIATVHELGNPACEVESARTWVFVDQEAVRQPAGGERRGDLAPGLLEPGGLQRAHAGGSPSALSSAAIAASDTWSSVCVASMMRKRAGAACASSR